jgi:hypothetical protein
MTHRTVYHPSEQEQLATIREQGDLNEYNDLISQFAEDEEEHIYGRLLGYEPEKEEEVYQS